MKKALLTFAIVTVAAFAARADVIEAYDVSGHGSPTEASTGATTIDASLNTGGSLNALTRSAGLLGAAANNSFSSTNWNIGAFDETSKYDTFTIQPSAALTLTSLDYAINGSNTAPGTGRWGYSVNGGAFVLQSPFAITNPQPVSLATWDFSDFGVNGGDTVEFRFWAFGTTNVTGGTSASTGTVRIANIAGNDLVLNGTAIPEPATIGLVGLGLAGLVAFARRRKA